MLRGVLGIYQSIYSKPSKGLLLYHLVCPAKYRRVLFTELLEQTLERDLLGIGERYETHAIETEADENHVHFLIQSVSIMSPSRSVQILKSIKEKEIFL